MDWSNDKDDKWCTHFLPPWCKADTRSNKYDKLLGYKSPETLTALPRELWNSTSDLIVLYPSGEKNTLTSDLNAHSILPDLVVKDKTELFKPLSFLKFGNADSSSADKLDDFVKIAYYMS